MIMLLLYRIAYRVYTYIRCEDDIVTLGERCLAEPEDNATSAVQGAAENFSVSARGKPACHTLYVSRTHSG